MKYVSERDSVLLSQFTYHKLARVPIIKGIFVMELLLYPMLVHLIDGSVLEP